MPCMTATEAARGFSHVLTRVARGEEVEVTRSGAPVAVIVPPKARLVGLNHVALEVGDLDEALEWYGRSFELTLRSRSGGMAFIDIGDQFLGFSVERSQPPDDHRHFGLVVDDREAVRAALAEAGIEPHGGRGLRFTDPWGNQFEIVEYADVQFSKTAGVLRGMGLEGLEKSDAARAELAEKGLGD